MTVVTIDVADTDLPQLLVRVEAGEAVVLVRGERPVAQLLSLTPKAVARRFGALRGKACVGPEFFEPVTDDELAGWEG